MTGASAWVKPIAGEGFCEFLSRRSLERSHRIKGFPKLESSANYCRLLDYFSLGVIIGPSYIRR